tara:strand:- start:159 stop:827 length:669 start_codon:yes stop_codon:yes gene_type:complete
MLISILTGIVAGAIHVIGGADHLISMMPSGLNKPKPALKDGLAWGVGHSAGVLLLSVLSITIKDLVHLEKMSSLAEFSVGISLLIVGAITIKTSFGLSLHKHQHKHECGTSHDHLHLHVRGGRRHGRHSHALASLGVLHGLAGASHLLAVIPALALPPVGAVAYLFAYLLGSIFTMMIFIASMSLAALNVSKKFFPIVVRCAGVLSLITGIIWIRKTSGFII